jgi:hypothetical protein
MCIQCVLFVSVASTCLSKFTIYILSLCSCKRTQPAQLIRKRHRLVFHSDFCHGPLSLLCLLYLSFQCRASLFQSICFAFPSFVTWPVTNFSLELVGTPALKAGASAGAFRPFSTCFMRLVRVRFTKEFVVIQGVASISNAFVRPRVPPADARLGNMKLPLIPTKWQRSRLGFRSRFLPLPQ